MKKVLLTVIAIFSIVLLAGCGGKNTLHCSMEQKDSGVDASTKIDVTFNGDKPSKVNMKMSMKVPEELASYMDILKSSLDSQKEELEEKGFSVKIETKNNTLTLTATASAGSITDNDIEGDYNTVKKTLEEEGYTCK